MNEDAWPRLVRIKRFSSGRYQGYWALRATDATGSWVLTKYYSPTFAAHLDMPQVHTAGQGFEKGAELMLELMGEERLASARAFERTIARLTQTVADEAAGKVVTTSGFRPGYSARQLAQALAGQEKNRKTWDAELVRIKKQLNDYGWRLTDQ